MLSQNDYQHVSDGCVCFYVYVRYRDRVSRSCQSHVRDGNVRVSGRASPHVSVRVHVLHFHGRVRSSGHREA